MSIIPYPGLRPFTREESDVFFGREEHTDQLIEKLSHNRFISVMGLSGCGKSSLVRAGMISALGSGYMASAYSHWKVAEMRPGSHPLRNLAEALLSDAGLAPKYPEHFETEAQTDIEKLSLFISSRGTLGLVELLHENPFPNQTNLLLIIDQFEEIFRYHHQADRDEVEAFIGLLLTSAEQREIPIYVVTTMRSDFIGECALFQGLPEVMNSGQFLIPRLTFEQLRMAIIGPARVFGGSVDPHLVNCLFNEMKTNPDQLPVLQHCLMRMWLHATKRMGGDQGEGEAGIIGLPTADGVTITSEDYEVVGRLENALSKHA